MLRKNCEKDNHSFSNDAPTFDHPWQAEAFGLVVQLHKDGHFNWTEWVGIFSEEIKLNPQRPSETQNDAYYRQWLGALESVTSRFISSDEMTQRSLEWRQAYLNTPHGEPVHLANSHCKPIHHHNHSLVSRVPIKVVPASDNLA